MWGLGFGRASARAGPLWVRRGSREAGPAVEAAARALRAAAELRGKKEAEGAEEAAAAAAVREAGEAAAERARALLQREPHGWTVTDLGHVLLALTRLGRLDEGLLRDWEAAALPRLSEDLAAWQVTALLAALCESNPPPSRALLQQWAHACTRAMGETRCLWRVAAGLHRLSFVPEREWWIAFAQAAGKDMRECPDLIEYLANVAGLAPEGTPLGPFLDAWEAAAAERIPSFSRTQLLFTLPWALRRLQHVPREALLRAWLAEAVRLLPQLDSVERWKVIPRILRLPFAATSEELGTLLTAWAESLKDVDLRLVNATAMMRLLIRLGELRWRAPGAFTERLLLELAERSWEGVPAAVVTDLGLHIALLLPRARVDRCAAFFRVWGARTAPLLSGLAPSVRVELLEVLAWLRVDGSVMGGQAWFEAWFAEESRGLEREVVAACAELAPDAQCAHIAEHAMVRAQLAPVSEVFATCVSADDSRVQRALEELKRLLEKHGRSFVPEQLVSVFFAAARNGFVGFHVLHAWQRAAALHLQSMSPALLMQCLDALSRCLPLPPSDEFMRAWTQATRFKLEFEQKPWIVANLLSRLRFRPDNAWMREFASVAAKSAGEAAGFVASLMSMASIGAPISAIRPFVEAWEAAAVARVHALDDRDIARRIIGAYGALRHVPGGAFFGKWLATATERLPRLPAEDRWALALKLLQLPFPNLDSCAPLLSLLLESISEAEFGRQSDGQLFALLARLRDWRFVAPRVWTERVVAELRRRLPNLPDRSHTFVASWMDAELLGPQLLQPLLSDFVKASAALLPSFVMYLLPSLFAAMERVGATPESIGEAWFRAWLAAAARHVELKPLDAKEKPTLLQECRLAAARLSADVDEVVVAKALFEASQKMPRHDRAKVAAAMDCMRVLLETRHASFPPAVLVTAFAGAAKLRRLDEELIHAWELAAEPRLGDMSGSELVQILNGLFLCRPLGVSFIFMAEWAKASAPKLEQLPELWRVANLLSVLNTSPDDVWWQRFAQEAPKHMHKCEALVEYLSDVSNCYSLPQTVKPFLAAWERVALPKVFSFSQLQIVRWIPGAFERLRHVPSDAFLEVFLARALQLMPRLTVRERWVLGERIAHIPFESTGMVGPFLDRWTRSFSRTELGRVDETPLMTVMWCFEEMGYIPSSEWLRNVLLELTERIAKLYSTKNLMNSLVLVSKLARPPLLTSEEFGSFVRAWAKESAPRLAALTHFSLLSALAAVVRVGASPATIGSEWFECFLRATRHAVGPGGDLMDACREAALKISPMDFKNANKAVLPHALENMRTVRVADQRVLLDWAEAVASLSPDELFRRNKLVRALGDLEAMMNPADIPPSLIRMCKEAEAELAWRSQGTWKPPPPTQLPPLPTVSDRT